MTSSPDIATPDRATLRIPSTSGDEIDAWVYKPAGYGPHPAIVMAHGFAGVKAGGLASFAERFCREGFTAIAFDYRDARLRGAIAHERRPRSTRRIRIAGTTDPCRRPRDHTWAGRRA